jgi:immune inhibitor A
MTKHSMVLVAGVMMVLVSLACDGGPVATQVAPTPVVIGGDGSTIVTPPPSPAPEDLAPPLSVDAIPEEGIVEDFLATAVPPDDPYDWAARDGRIAWDSPHTSSTAHTYQLGDVETFTLDEGHSVDAQLVAISEHAYFWVEVGQPADSATYNRVAQLFEEAYPIEHRYFGMEASPGVDGDPRVFVLNTTGIGEDTLGYFSPPDQLTRAVDPLSNEHEMFYMSLDAFDAVGSDLYMATLTHEFQHMIQSTTDPNESNWVDEGLAQMAETLTGYPGYAEDVAYLRSTDTPLTFWDAYGDTSPYYASNFLFWLYLWEQFGDDFFIQAAQSPREGLLAVEEALAAQGADRSVYQVFSDWTVANLVADRTIDSGRYGYDHFDAGSVSPIHHPEQEPPFQQTYTIDQFTPHYHELSGGTTYSIDFTGDTVAQFVPTTAYSGQSFWWSNRRDASHTRLMRTFDLTGLSSATLQYALWYNIEQDYDVMYISASTDGGNTWSALAGRYMHSSAGEASLPGYTGSSGGWITDQVDLTPFAGGPVLVSFDYRTDVNYTLDGVALDDIQVLELGFADNAEVADPGWQAEGWIHTDNSTPQHWGIYVVTLGDPPTVAPIPVDSGQAHIEGSFPAGVSDVFLVIAASAPVTGVPAEYTLSFAGDFEAVQPRTVAYGQTVSGELTDFEMEQDWRFEGSAGDVVTIYAPGVNNLDTYLELYAPTGDMLTEDDDSGRNTVDWAALIQGYTLPTTGTYRINVWAWTSEGYCCATGGYDLTLTSP